MKTSGIYPSGCCTGTRRGDAQHQAGVRPGGCRRARPCGWIRVNNCLPMVALAGEAADVCASGSNAEAVLMLPRFSRQGRLCECFHRLVAHRDLQHPPRGAGLGPRQRLEIHNLGHAIEQLDADIVCLQEVHQRCRRQQYQFTTGPTCRKPIFWRQRVTKRSTTNAVTRHGEHGNALLSRWPMHPHRIHGNMSDHRSSSAACCMWRSMCWARGARDRGAFGPDSGQPHPAGGATGATSTARSPEAALVVAGDFNDWGAHPARSMVSACVRGRCRCRPTVAAAGGATGPDLCPWTAADALHAAPRGRIWGRMSDHLPLIGEFGLT